MTSGQARCLAAIQELTVGGVTPTFEELRVHLGLASKSGIHRLVTDLEKQGAIRRVHGRRQAIVVVETGRDATVSRLVDRANEHHSIADDGEIMFVFTADEFRAFLRDNL